MKTDSKQTVLSVYPHAEIRIIIGTLSKKEYWMIYDYVPDESPELLGWSLESAEAAWKKAADVICHRMFKKLAR